MAEYKEHCADCEKALGKQWNVVHKWLDELFFQLGPKHRSVRHHLKGIEEVRKMWGDDGAKAAAIHISKDYYGKIPKDENEAQLWDIMGPSKMPQNGETFLTDEEWLKK